MKKYNKKLIILWVVFAAGIILIMSSTGLGTIAVYNLTKRPQGVAGVDYPIFLEQYITKYRVLGSILSILSGLGIIMNIDVKS